MATMRFRGDAPRVAQVNTWAFGGTWEANDIIRVTFATGRYYDFTAGSTTTATVVSNLVTAWNALDSTVYPEWAELTASANSTTFTLTAKNPGIPFAVTLQPFETGGGAADSQTIEGGTSAAAGTAATANSGPEAWNVAANWTTGTVPTTGDTVILENSSANILYGLSQSSVTLAAFYIRASFTGRIGLPTTNVVGGAVSYYEYRATVLAISATVLSVGEGAGGGSSRIKIDTGSNATTVSVFKTAAAADAGNSAFMWIGDHASNAMNVYAGSVGIAGLAGETAQLPTLNINGTSSATGSGAGPTVYCGSGMTSGTTLKMSAGTVTVNGATTSITVNGGTLTINGTGATPILDNFGGTVVYNSTGAIGGTRVTVGTGATLDFDQDARAKTVSSDIQAYRGAKIFNGTGAVASLPVDAVGCRIADLEIRSPFGADITIA